MVVKISNKYIKKKASGAIPSAIPSTVDNISNICNIGNVGNVARNYKKR
jgi:hypothetical protein